MAYWERWLSFPYDVGAARMHAFTWTMSTTGLLQWVFPIAIPHIYSLPPLDGTGRSDPFMVLSWNLFVRYLVLMTQTKVKYDNARGKVKNVGLTEVSQNWVKINPHIFKGFYEFNFVCLNIKVFSKTKFSSLQKDGNVWNLEHYA